MEQTKGERGRRSWSSSQRGERLGQRSSAPGNQAHCSVTGPDTVTGSAGGPWPRVHSGPEQGFAGTLGSNGRGQGGGVGTCGEAGEEDQRTGPG
jgi:hypothetical protein